MAEYEDYDYGTEEYGADDYDPYEYESEYDADETETYADDTWVDDTCEYDAYADDMSAGDADGTGYDSDEYDEYDESDYDPYEYDCQYEYGEAYEVGDAYEDGETSDYGEYGCEDAYEDDDEATYDYGEEYTYSDGGEAQSEDAIYDYGEWDTECSEYEDAWEADAEDELADTEAEDYSYEYASPDAYYGEWSAADVVEPPLADESGYSDFAEDYPATGDDECDEECCDEERGDDLYGESGSEGYGYGQEDRDDAGRFGSEHAYRDRYRNEASWDGRSQGDESQSEEARPNGGEDSACWEDTYGPESTTPTESEPGEVLHRDDAPSIVVPEAHGFSVAPAEDVYAEKYGWYDEAPLTPSVEDGASAGASDEAEGRLELYAWLPGELLTSSDQDLLRSLARLCDDPSGVRRAVLNDHLESLGSEAIEFATQFEDATGVEVLGLADDLPGAAALLGCFRLMEQGELGMDESADLLRRALPNISEEWSKDVAEMTDESADSEPWSWEEADEDPDMAAQSADYRFALRQPLLGAVVTVTARSLVDWGGAFRLVTERVAGLQWADLARLALPDRAASIETLEPTGLQR